MAKGLHVIVYRLYIKIVVFWIALLFVGFCFSLIRSAFSNSQNVSLNDMMLADNESKGIWKEASLT
jgi:hypothetical protein